MPVHEPKMMPEPSGQLADVSGADATRLRKIWPGNNLDMPWRPHELGDVLSHQLAAELDIAPSAGPAGTLGRATYADLLLRDAAPPLGVLRGVKDWAKPFTFCDDGELPREVAGVLYYAAILAARLRLGKRISEQEDALLARAARWALRLPWLDASMTPLFTEAVASLETGPAE